MAEALHSTVSAKRPRSDTGPHEDRPSSKRAFSEPHQTDAHLTLLEELCNLDVVDGKVHLSSSDGSVSQEDLVTEMMKSLERVIGESGTATTGESSPRSTCSETATPVGERLAESGAPVDQTPFDLELLWRCLSSYEDDSNSPSPDGAATPCGQIQEVDPYIRRIVEASDYELGLTDVSDLDGSLHGSWNYVSDNSPCSSSSPATSYWFDAPFQQFEEAIETYDPVLF